MRCNRGWLKSRRLLPDLRTDWRARTGEMKCTAGERIAPLPSSSPRLGRNLDVQGKYRTAV